MALTPSQWNLAVNVGLELRSALSSMVFRKAMRLRRITGSGGNTAGQLVNIISTDPERVIMACNVRTASLIRSTSFMFLQPHLSNA